MKKIFVLLVLLTSFVLADNCLWKEEVNDLNKTSWLNSRDRSVTVFCFSGKKFYTFDHDVFITNPADNDNWKCDCEKK